MLLVMSDAVVKVNGCCAHADSGIKVIMHKIAANVASILFLGWRMEVSLFFVKNLYKLLIVN